MRILLILAHSDMTGAVYAVSVADQLIARGHDVFIVSDAAYLNTRAHYAQMQLGTGSLWRTARGIVSLVGLIRRHRIQVVHAHSPSVRWASWLATRLARVPMVNTNGYGMHTGVPSPVPVEQGRSDQCDPAVDWLEQVCRSTYVNSARLEIPILCYHRLVERDEDGGTISTHLRVDRFEAQLRYLRDHDYRTLHFADFDNTQIFTKTQRAVVLTFDDGYEDNYRLLFPLLKKYKAKAVIYLVSGLQRNEWDVQHGEKPLRLLNHVERREMLESGLVEFGAHTVTHADLSTLNPDQASMEIRQSKIQLEAELGVPVQTFAFPYGHFSAQATALVRQAGFRYALVTNSGPLAIHEDAFHVRRIVVFPSITMRRFKRKVSGEYVQRTTHGRDAYTSPTGLVRR